MAGLHVSTTLHIYACIGVYKVFFLHTKDEESETVTLVPIKERRSILKVALCSLH